MAGDNPSGAGNQQERLNCSAWLDRISPDVGHYIAGFVDGKGSFNVPIRRERDRLLPWRVGLTFTSHRSDRSCHNCSGRFSAQERFEVVRTVCTTSRSRGWPSLKRGVFPFFERFELRGPKK